MLGSLLQVWSRPKTQVKQPMSGTKQPKGQLQTLTLRPEVGAQLQAPTKHVLGKSPTLAQQSCVVTSPPEAMHSAAAKAGSLTPPSLFLVLLLVPVVPPLEAPLSPPLAESPPTLVSRVPAI